LVEIINVLDASELSSEQGRQEVHRHEVADCIFETTRPIAFDLSHELEGTGRFVLVDNYEIAGGGIVTANATVSESVLREHIRRREAAWEPSAITSSMRAARYGHRAKFLVLTGVSEEANKALARALEERLFRSSHHAYYLGLTTIDRGLDSDVLDPFEQREERLRRLGELARIVTDSGQIFITTIAALDAYDVERLAMLNEPNELLVVVVGSAEDDQLSAQVRIPSGEPLNQAVERIFTHLREQEIITDYSI
jgi:bifunctional enzyme CysN/CysC